MQDRQSPPIEFFVLMCLKKAIVSIENIGSIYNAGVCAANV